MVIAFGQLSGKIISPIMTASDTWIRFKSSKKLTEKYMAILHSEEGNHPKREKQAVYGDIRLTNVSLIFNETKGLNNFSAVFKKRKEIPCGWRERFGQEHTVKYYFWYV